jgi:predicted RNase H-like HicB family nuclease
MDTPPKRWFIRSNDLPIVMRSENGIFHARFPAIAGCAAMGRSYDEAVLNVAKAIVKILEVRDVASPDEAA